MKLRLWLVLGLAGTVACGTSESGAGGLSDPGRPGGKKDAGTRDASSDDDDEDDVSDEDDAPTPRRDSGVSRPDAGSSEPDPGEACEKFSVPARANAPDILIVLDRSGSMTQGGRWNPSVNAIKSFTSTLDSAVAFGLMLYPEPAPGIAGIGLGLDANGLCGPGKVNIPFKTGNAAAIAAKLNESPPGRNSATPTAASIQAARDVVVTPVCGDCPKKEKFVVLVTDGQPNCTNGTDSSSSDVPNTIAAIEAIADEGVKTYVVGYGTKTDRALAQTMDQFAKAGGTGQHFAVENEATFLEELTKIAGEVISCEYELTKEVDDPKYVRVAIDGESYAYGTDWTLEDKKRVILQGAACDTLRDARTHNIEITVECLPVQVL